MLSDAIRCAFLRFAPMKPLQTSEPKPWLVDAGAEMRKARKAAGLNQKDLCELLNLPQSVISDWETGKLGSWQSHLDALARHIHWAPQDNIVRPLVEPRLTPAQQIEVIGDVQGGAFRMAVEYAYEDRYAVPVAPLPGYERLKQMALRVVGPSVNLVYPEGTFVIVVSAREIDVREGDMVVVYKTQGDLREATIKQLRTQDDGRIGLYPRSDHPDFQQPLFLSPGDEHNQDAPEIAYVVVGSYRPEPRSAPTAPAWVNV